MQLDHAEFVRLYGAWAGRTPRDAAALMAGFDAPWWMAGGWAIEAFTGVPRPHEDCDLGILRQDVARFRRHVAGRLDVWTAAKGALCPLLPDDRPDAPADEILPADCGQFWTRPGAARPWEYDVLLAPGDRETWMYRRDPSIRMPMRQALWADDGVPYLKPEIQLLYKAPGLRPKDQADFEAALPLLSRESREWLAASLRSTLGSHPWLARLA